MQANKSSSPLRAVLLALVLGALAPLLPWGLIYLSLVLRGDPDGASGWCALGVVTVPFGALTGLVTSSLSLRKHPWLGFALGFAIAWIAFAACFFERESPGFVLVNGIGFVMSAGAALWVSRRSARLSTSKMAELT